MKVTAPERAGALRVALVHSFYAGDQPSGENVAVLAQADALAEAGAEVLLLGRETDRERGLTAYPLRAAWRTATGLGPDPTLHLRRFRPDVVHVHNTVPNLGTRWLAAWPGPIVHTLHNFRSLCANALLFRNGNTCTLCPDGRRWSGVQHGCYRSSALASLPISVRNVRGDVVAARADRLIALSPFAAGIFTRYGVGADRLRVVPNGVGRTFDSPGSPPAEPSFALVGRLRSEKGVGPLVAAWPQNVALHVYGDGPLLGSLRRAAPPSVHFHGVLASDEVRSALRRHTGLVFPSTCPESAVALVVQEAFEAGLPVIVADEGAQTRDLVTTGAVRAVASGHGGLDRSSLAQALAWAVQGGATLRTRARNVYEARYRTDRWAAGLLEVYREAIAERGGVRSA